MCELSVVWALEMRIKKAARVAQSRAAPDPSEDESSFFVPLPC